MSEITSLQNPKIKEAAKLKERKEREESGLFLIEGYRELKRAADAGVTIPTLFICPSLFLGVNEKELIEGIRESGAEIYFCTEAVLSKLSYRDRPDGLIAVAVQMRRVLGDLAGMKMKNQAPFFLIAEGIEKPGNLGSILRSADAAGVDGVIVCDRCTDIYNPNVVRASVGTLFTIPVVEAQGGETLFWLREKKIAVVASSPAAKATFTETDLCGPVAIVVGSEQLGISDPWLKACDIKVSIPMKGIADSLNVATATTLLLYEVLRQRSASLLR